MVIHADPATPVHFELSPGSNLRLCPVVHDINQTPEQTARDRIDERLRV